MRPMGVFLLQVSLLAPTAGSRANQDPAGRYSFEVVDETAGPAPKTSAPTRPLGPQSMTALRSTGELSRAVVLGNHVVTAGFARQIPKDINVAIQDINWQFGAGEKALNAFVSWGPQARLKGILRFRLLDDQNRVVAEAKPSKIDLRAGMRVISHWEMPMPAAGVYRAEVLIDDALAWREFVTIVP